MIHFRYFGVKAEYLSLKTKNSYAILATGYLYNAIIWLASFYPRP